MDWSTPWVVSAGLAVKYGNEDVWWQAYFSNSNLIDHVNYGLLTKVLVLGKL